MVSPETFLALVAVGHSDQVVFWAADFVAASEVVASAEVEGVVKLPVTEVFGIPEMVWIEEVVLALTGVVLAEVGELLDASVLDRVVPKGVVREASVVGEVEVPQEVGVVSTADEETEVV